MPSRNSSRAASGRSRAGWSGSRRLLDAGNLRDDARLLRPAVDGTYEDGEPEWAPTRWRVRSTAATVRPASRTGRTAARDGRRHGRGRSRLQGGPRARRRRRHDLSHTAGAGSTPVRQWAWEGPWAAATHGGRGRRGWRKRHRGVDPSGVIRVHTLTEETGDDATLALDRLTAVKGPLARVTADAASDTVAIDETARARGATVVVPPARTATGSGHGPRSPARDRTIPWVKTLGRCRWKQVSGSHRQGRVENTCVRDTSIIGDGLRARSPARQGSAVVLGCAILNRMTALGRPVLYRLGR